MRGYRSVSSQIIQLIVVEALGYVVANKRRARGAPNALICIGGKLGLSRNPYLISRICRDFAVFHIYQSNFFNFYGTWRHGVTNLEVVGMAMLHLLSAACR